MYCLKIIAFFSRVGHRHSEDKLYKDNTCERPSHRTEKAQVLCDIQNRVTDQVQLSADLYMVNKRKINVHLIQGSLCHSSVIN